LIRRVPIFLACLCAAWSAQQQPASISADDVISHLEKSIAWFRHVTGQLQSSSLSGDVLLRENTRQSATKAVQLAFDFARAEATLTRSSQPQQSSAASGNRSTGQIAAKAENRVNAMQDRIDALNDQISKAPARSRDLLLAQRKQLDAGLAMAKQIRSTAQSMINFIGESEAGSRGNAGLSGQIDELERSVPEARRDQSAATQQQMAKQVSSGPAPFDPSSEGLVNLAITMFSAQRERMQLKQLMDETDSMVKSIDVLRAPILTSFRNAVHRSEEITNASDTQSIDEVTAGQREIGALIDQVKQITAAMAPLREQQAMMEATRASLEDGSDTLADRYAAAGRRLLLRTLLLGGVVLMLLVISEAMRRGTIKYIRDQRRRRQFLVLRRVFMGFLIAIVILMGFVSQLGSVATYAGFLTAGIAVALQSVILSVVGYFFLIGRYGFRVGDRVTVGGVTGKVIDVGLVRLYLMELGGSGPDLQSTGRIVVFSNSVLFQPTALYKQMPGTDYIWHTVKLVLTRDSDFELAEKLLLQSLNKVYEQYRPDIEQQHDTFERSVDLQLAKPAPEGRVRFVEEGLEFIGRYPVQLKNIPEADDQIMKALQEVVEREPRLSLAASGNPRVLAPV